MIKTDFNLKIMTVIADKTDELAKGLFTFDDLYKRILAGKQNGCFRILYKEENDIIKGLMLYEIVYPFDKAEIYIWLTWIDSNEKEVCAEFCAEVERFAREQNISKISTGTRREDRLKALHRKYGLSVESIILSKTLTKE